MAMLIAILACALVYALWWIITCGLIKLITLCFGLAFSWPIATGIWLIIVILRSSFEVTAKK